MEDKEYEKPYMFILTCEKEDLYFAAENEAELEEWVLVLKDEIEVTDNSTSKFVVSKNALWTAKNVELSKIYFERFRMAFTADR